MYTIKECATQLKLPYLKTNWEEILSEAHVKDMSCEDFLLEVLNAELNLRSSNSIKTKIKNAKFPYRIILEDYERDHFSTELKLKIKQLETMEFLKNGQNVILIGNPGTGKTALAIALGIKACMEGKNVLFVSIPTLLMEIKEAMSQNQLLKYKRKFEKYDLVILDELGYVSFDKERGEILFNLISSRSEKGSTIITSNLTYDRWNEIFNDKVLTGAVIDRISKMSYLLDMTGESYRIIATKRWNERNQEQLNDK
ncbi:MAG: IS21-like element helper ATPase IstB [Bacillota bacterium]|nr:IS21-like element helper ATPase IstB [Bacillota bacterium]